jgi:hypothetical protein
MFNNTIAQRITVGLGAMVAGLAISTTMFAGAASAQPIGPDGPSPKAGHCPIVDTDSNGNDTVTYVPTGSRDGLMVCGADGEWHTGWLITEMAPTGGGGIKNPVVVGGGSVVAERR